ncbi:MAG: hypothetical protein ABSG03_33155 [Bryobacteraceae bacterium]
MPLHPHRPPLGWSGGIPIDPRVNAVHAKTVGKSAQPVLVRWRILAVADEQAPRMGQAKNAAILSRVVGSQIALSIWERRSQMIRQDPNAPLNGYLLSTSGGPTTAAARHRGDKGAEYQLVFTFTRPCPSTIGG